ncbi:hypothetical protein Pmani_037897 [Petrolisthes manimaculis]|uniref:Uncharacterized protein n=1 Tax=Petrolisthes manimaculis TaxID=1843537 RepID=A0AAE1NFX2_9EUCA|nr:hypothetical protein Pmani_037897 [Petrolisthes manimaculis]
MIVVDEREPIGELPPPFPPRNIKVKEDEDIRALYDLKKEIGRVSVEGKGDRRVLHVTVHELDEREERRGEGKEEQRQEEEVEDENAWRKEKRGIREKRGRGKKRSRGKRRKWKMRMRGGKKKEESTSKEQQQPQWRD